MSTNARTIPAIRHREWSTPGQSGVQEFEAGVRLLGHDPAVFAGSPARQRAVGVFLSVIALLALCLVAFVGLGLSSSALPNPLAMTAHHASAASVDALHHL